MACGVGAATCCLSWLHTETLGRAATCLYPIACVWCPPWFSLCPSASGGEPQAVLVPKQARPRAPGKLLCLPELLGSPRHAPTACRALPRAPACSAWPWARRPFPGKETGLNSGNGCMRGRRGHPLASSKAGDAPLCFVPSRVVGHICAVVRKLMAALRQWHRSWQPSASLAPAAFRTWHRGQPRCPKVLLSDGGF